jgi:mannosyltransferase OCH1-like enzyme
MLNTQQKLGLLQKIKGLYMKKNKQRKTNLLVQRRQRGVVYPEFTKEMYMNIPFPLKEKYNSVIPLNIFQTWKTKDLHPLLKANQEKLIRENPEFNYALYDDNDCREFLEKYFPPYVLAAFDSLIPGAYKADLWRYCVLYIHGGIYLDMRFEMINGFKLIAFTESEHFTLDIPGQWMPNKIGIYNAIMVCKPRNPFLLRCIKQVIYNVKMKFYGFNPLYPTGPGLLGLIVEKQPYRRIVGPHIDIYHVKEGFYYVFKNRLILHSIDGYDSARSNTPYYATAYANRKIYK